MSENRLKEAAVIWSMFLKSENGTIENEALNTAFSAFVIFHNLNCVEAMRIGTEMVITAEADKKL